MHVYLGVQWPDFLRKKSHFTILLINISFKCIFLDYYSKYACLYFNSKPPFMDKDGRELWNGLVQQSFLAN